jgi:hypothetical protein
MADSDYLENALLDHVLGGGDFTRPANVTLYLYTATPSDSGGGTKVSGNGFSALVVTNNATNFPAASGGAKSNGTVLDFGTPSGAGWGTVVAVGVEDGSGNLLKWGAVTPNKACPAGDPVQFAIGALSFTHD